MATEWLQRHLQPAAPTEAQLVAQRQALCASKEVRDILSDATLQKIPEELKLCLDTAGKGGSTYWQTAQQAFGWPAEQRRLDTLQAKIRVKAELSAGSAYAGRKRERAKVASDVASYEKSLAGLATYSECQRAAPETPVQRACDKVKEDFRDIIDRIKLLESKVNEANKLASQAAAEEKVLAHVEPAVRAWQSGVGDVKDLEGQIKASRAYLHTIVTEAKSLQEKAAKKRNEVAKLQKEVDEDAKKMKYYVFQLYRLIEAAKTEMGVQQGHWWNADGEEFRLEGNTEWKKANKRVAQEAGIKEGTWLHWSREEEAWVPESKEQALRKRGWWYDEDEKAWLHQRAKDDKVWKKTSRGGKDVWHVFDTETQRWKKPG